MDNYLKMLIDQYAAEDGSDYSSFLDGLEAGIRYAADQDYIPDARNFSRKVRQECGKYVEAVYLTD